MEKLKGAKLRAPDLSSHRTTTTTPHIPLSMPPQVALNDSRKLPATTTENMSDARRSKPGFSL